jgi:hypothetical protein
LVRIPTLTNNNNNEINSQTLEIIKIQNPNNNKYKNIKPVENNQTRDLYNRTKKLKYWTDRIHTDLDVYDKKDVLTFLEIMQEKGN